MRRFLVLAFGFAFAFVLLAAWLGPRYLAWYFRPPVELGPNTFNCTDPMLRALQWGMNRLLLIELVAAGVGLVTGLVLSLLTRKREVAVADAALRDAAVVKKP